VHLLEHPWHGEDERRPVRAQLIQDVGDVGGMHHRRPRLHHPHLDHAGERMREGQEQDRRRPGMQ